MTSLRLLGLAVFLLVASVSSAVAGSAAKLVTAAELKTQGVLVRRMQLATPLASATVETYADNSQFKGKYIGVECIVASEEVSPDNVTHLDETIDQPNQTLRRNNSDQVRASFIVLGREVSRAYLAFSYATKAPDGAELVQRYLLPVAQIRARPYRQ